MALRTLALQKNPACFEDKIARITVLPILKRLHLSAKQILIYHLKIKSWSRLMH